MPFADISVLRRIGASGAVGSLLAAGLIAAGPAQAVTDKVLTEADVNLNYTRAAGSNTFGADGIVVKTTGATSLSKAAGYFAVDLPLADAGEPTMDWDGTTPVPGMQLVVDLDNNGTEDGTLVGEPSYGGNWWLAPKTLAEVDVSPSIRALAPKETNGGSPDAGTLAQWRSAFPSAKIKQAGWTLGSGIEGEGTLYRISVGSTDYSFRAAAVAQQDVHRSDVAARDTRTSGRSSFRSNGGVRIYTVDSTSQAKSTGYFAVSEPLAAAGEPTWDYRATSGIEPGKQLVIDLDGDRATTTDRGILVGEPVYGKNWWLSNGSSESLKAIAPQTGGGQGSNWFGTLNQWRLKAPNALVLEAGWSMGSGVQADGVLNSFTVGQTTYSFAGNRAPVAPDVTAAYRAGDGEIRIPLNATDADTSAYIAHDGVTATADTLTLAVDGADGDVEVDGNELVYSHDAIAAAGTDTFDYTATDDRGASTTGEVTISLAANRAPKLSARNVTGKVNRTAVIAVTAADPDGDAVTVTTSAASHATAKVAANGKSVTVTPRRNFVGRATVRITATDSRGASTSATVTVAVSKFDSTAKIGRIYPSKPTSKKAISVRVSVKAPGTDVGGDRITVTKGSKVLGSGRLDSRGKGLVVLKSKLPKGVHTLTLRYAGNAEIDSSRDALRIRVK